MTKVMDLFRHRSNSAVSEADKRKAVSNALTYNLNEKFDENYVNLGLRNPPQLSDPIINQFLSPISRLIKITPN